MLYRVNHTGRRARYYVTTTGWTGGRTLNPRHETGTINLARGEGAIYAGTLAHLPHAGPLFAGSARRADRSPCTCSRPCHTRPT